MTPNGKQHYVLKIHEFFRGNPTDFFQMNFPSGKIPKSVERRHQSWQQRNNSLPFPEAALARQIGLDNPPLPVITVV